MRNLLKNFLNFSKIFPVFTIAKFTLATLYVRNRMKRFYFDATDNEMTYYEDHIDRHCFVNFSVFFNKVAFENEVQFISI
jgi:hypothetical protein